MNSQYGIGHFQRICAVLSALEERNRNDRAMLLFGGVPWDGFSRLTCTARVELPGLSFQRSEKAIANTPSSTGSDTPLANIMKARRQLIGAVTRRWRVNLLLVEYFPFSKQFLADEVEFLIGALRERQGFAPTVVVSLRDFITVDPSFSALLAQEFVRHHNARILVHADPRFASRAQGVLQEMALGERIVYSGVVVRELRTQSELPRQRRIIVSAGGGRDGERVFLRFQEALLLLGSERLRDWNVTIFPGPFCPSDFVEELVHTVRRHGVRTDVGMYSDYEEALAQAAISVSMCGYNTAYELLAARVPYVTFVPRDRAEQQLRASFLEELGAAQVARDAVGLAGQLLKGMTLDLWRAPRESPPIALNGGGRSAELLMTWAAENGPAPKTGR